MTKDRSPLASRRPLVIMFPIAGRIISLALLLVAARPLAAQAGVPPNRDSLATVRILVQHETNPAGAAVVRSLDATDAAGRALGARTDGSGRGVVRLPAGVRRLLVSRLGFRPDTLSLRLRAAQDTSVVVQLESLAEEVETFVVSATRAERRVDDTPIRVEVVDEEEVGEKLAMRPASIQMLLAETGGLRVQTTNPSLGNANVRVQGLRGRYALLLTDGLPLAGDGGGFSLLQTPIDLSRVEVLKGTTGLYSGGAGGVINLMSRRPASESEHTALLNQTSRGGSDALAFFTGPLSERWGYTLLTGLHRQQRNDLDADGWTDVPGYERAAVRPRLFYDDGRGRTAFFTGGYTAEDRTGGTMRAGVLPGGASFAEALRLRRGDVGALARWALTDSTTPAALRPLRGAIMTLRGSLTEQQHGHRFGEVREQDRHRTWFGEASVAVQRGRATYVAGAAFQQDAYRNTTVSGWDYIFNSPAAFAQVDIDPTAWLSLSSSARVDVHNVYGTFVNPRVSMLVRSRSDGAFARWTARVSGGTGLFAPTPLVEEVEAVGLGPVVPTAAGVAAFRAERVRSGSVDVGGPLALSWGTLEVNGTAFVSHLRDPLQARAADGVTASGASRLALITAPAPTRTWGTELLARLVRTLGEAREDGDEATALRVTATYAYLRSTECDPDQVTGGLCMRREVPLTPRHAATFVASIEQEGKSRLGLEVYYTGRQSLDRETNPFRAESRPYVLVGLLGERAFETRAGVARLFVNLENLTNVRQTRVDPLLLPARGRGGRWSTDAWTELVGFTVNGGVRFGF